MKQTERKAEAPLLPKISGKDIVIPSVPRWEDSQSLGSQSWDTMSATYSFLTPNQSAKKKRSNAGTLRTGGSPVKIKSNGRVILQVPSPTLDKFGSSPDRLFGASHIGHALPPLLSSSAAVVHRPSGELSVSLASVASQSEIGSPPKKKYTHRDNAESLWDSGGNGTSLEVLEEHLKLEMLAATLAQEQERQEKLRLQEELERQQAAHEEVEPRREESDELQFLNFRLARRGTVDSAQSEFVVGLRDSLSRLAASKLREKLHNLAKYINGHTNRKILSCWNMIESRFKQSSVFKVVLTPNNQGLMHPVRHNALPVSTLLRIVCSSRVRVGHGEAGVMLDRIGIKDEDVILGLMIAALNVVVQVCTDGNSDMAAVYRDQMLELLNLERAMVSITELREEIFSSDPVERASQMEEIKNRKQLEVTAMLAEKRKKEEMKVKQELSRKKMIDDFEKALDQLQVMKRVFNRVCADNFLHAVDFSRKTVAQYYEELSSKVPSDLVFFLGVQHFPQTIQAKIMQRLKSYHLDIQQKFMDSAPLRSLSRISSTLSEAKGAEITSSGANSPTILSRAESGNRGVPSVDSSSQLKDKALALFFDFEDFTDMRVESVTRIKLAGSPGVLPSLRALVALGRTFPRFSFRDIVEIMQFVAATKICAFFRGFSRRWRYRAARSKWRKIFRGLRVKYYEVWASIVKRRRIIRSYCYRKVVAWKYYTKRIIQRRETFRACFWPFYVWRKFAGASATAKEKSRFLVGRVMPTLTMMKVFRAWKEYGLQEAHYKRMSSNFRQSFVANQCLRSLCFWKDWAHQRVRIRKAWYRRAKAMRRKNLYLILKGRFLTWRIFVWFRVQMRLRVGLLRSAFRKQLLPASKPWKKLSYTEKRLLRGRRRRELEAGGGPHKKRERRNLKKDQERRARGESVSSSRSSVGSTSKVSAVGETGSRKPSLRDDDAVSGGSDAALSSVAKFNQNFKWKVDMKSWLDMDSDGEDEEDIPELLRDAYSESVQFPFPTSVDSVPFLQDKVEDFAKERFTSTSIGYSYRDYWNLLDAAMRFHRYAYLAFRNLRLFAKVRKRYRKFRQRRREQILRIVWKGWRAYTQAGGGPLRNADGSSTAPSEAEVLYYQVRTHMSGKLLRTRKLVAEISKHYNRDAEMDSDNEEEKAIRQMKNLNLISDDNDDDYSFIEAEKQRARQRAAEIKRKKEKALLMYGDYQPPNIVELDEKDRRRELALAEKMVKYSKGLKASLAVMTEVADTSHVDATAKRKQINDMVDEVLTLEGNATDRAITKQHEYALKFKEHAADNLITVLAKVYREVQKKLIQDESKIYFRGLRLPMLIARSKKMLARKKIRNYIRLCNRLRSLYSKAPYYYRVRTMWVTFNRWIKFLSVSKLDPTPGLVEMVERKLDLHPDFHYHLQGCGYKEGSYCHDDDFRRLLSDFRVLFSRWKMYTQERLLFRILNEKVARIFRYKLLRKVLWALRTGLSLRDYSQRISFEPKCFPITRLQADVDQIIKRFTPLRRRQLPAMIKKLNRIVITRIKQSGRKAETFKNFLKQFLGQISLRLSTEQRLLHEAFEERGTQEFVDMLAPNKYHSIIPPIMTKLDGKPFFDPHINPKLVTEPTIPAGFRIARIKWAMQLSAGGAAGGSNLGGGGGATLLGWQLVWSADGTPEVESMQRGQWHNAGISIQETLIPKEDFLIGLEYLYDGPVIVGVRLKLFHGGFTKWIGGKTSLSTLSVYMGVDQEDLAPRLPFEENRLQDRDELQQPALPYAMVIGLSGLLHNNRTTNIGLVVRKIRKQNIFSYYWVEDVLERYRLQLTEYGGFTVANGVDAMSVPSHLQFNVETSNLADDSITMDETETGNRITDEDHGMEEEGEEKEANEELEETEGEESHGDEGDENASLETTQSAIERRNQRMLGPRIAKKFAKWMKQDELGIESLTSPETQFFDILRMRMTELSSAKTRADEFARRVWTSRDVRTHPQLSKLVNLRIVARLTQWFFNAISRRLIPFCVTERRGLALHKLSRRLENKAKMLLRRARNNRSQAALLESSRHSWDGKPVLGPQERAAKKQMFQQVLELRSSASKLEEEARGILEEAKVNEELGVALLPRISLNLAVYNNFKTKMAAARHKESLLERMSLDQIKHGLFGSNMKETLLNKDQMQAIHASLRDRVIVMKDTTSLQKLVDNVLSSERSLAKVEKRASINDIHSTQSQQRNRIGGAQQRISVLHSSSAGPSKAPPSALPKIGAKHRRIEKNIRMMATHEIGNNRSRVLNNLSYDDTDQAVVAEDSVPQGRRS